MDKNIGNVNSQPAKEQEPVCETGFVRTIHRWFKDVPGGTMLFAAPVHQLYWCGKRIETQDDLIALVKEEAGKGFDAGVRSVQQEASRIAELESAIDRLLSDIDDDGIAERADIAVLALRNVRAGRPMHEGLDVAAPPQAEAQSKDGQSDGGRG